MLGKVGIRTFLVSLHRVHEPLQQYWHRPDHSNAMSAKGHRTWATSPNYLVGGQCRRAGPWPIARTPALGIVMPPQEMRRTDAPRLLSRGAPPLTSLMANRATRRCTKLAFPVTYAPTP